MSTPIEYLKLENRAWSALVRNNVETIEQLEEKIADGTLQECPGIGETLVSEILSTLSSYKRSHE